MKELIKVLNEEEIKLRPVLSTRKKMCKDCNLKEYCNKELRTGHQIIFVPKGNNCLVA